MAAIRIERRVDDVLSRMTLAEKLGQLNMPCVYLDALGKTREEKLAARWPPLRRVPMSRRQWSRSRSRPCWRSIRFSCPTVTVSARTA